MPPGIGSIRIGGQDKTKPRNGGLVGMPGNKVFLIGSVNGEPIIRQGANHKPFATFWLANGNSRHKIVVVKAGLVTDVIGPYVEDGRMLVIQGELIPDREDGYRIVVSRDGIDDLIML